MDENLFARSWARSYEQSAHEDRRSRQGLFYTPDAVADVVASGAIELWMSEHAGVSLEGRAVVDPSCGAGALLAAVVRAIPRVEVRLLGTDLDPIALALARERLGERANLHLGDALVSGPPGDLVLTNPPYGRDVESDDIDRYITFWRAAVLRVRPWGVLAVLTPRSWRTGLRYARARREVIGPAGVRHVVDLPRGAFPDAYVDTCVAFCLPHSPPRAVVVPPGKVKRAAPARPSKSAREAWTTLDALFVSRRGILAPKIRTKGESLLLGPVAPFAWPKHRSAFAYVRPGDVVEGKAALALDRGPRLLVRRIVGRAARLTCVVARERALVKKDFYVLVPRDPALSLEAYAALLHAQGTLKKLARAEVASTKDDFPQVTLTRLRELPMPKLAPSHPATAWLTAWAKEAEALGHSLSGDGTRQVDGDPRWAPLRARLDAFVSQLDAVQAASRRARSARRAAP